MFLYLSPSAPSSDLTQTSEKLWLFFLLLLLDFPSPAASSFASTDLPFGPICRSVGCTLLSGQPVCLICPSTRFHFFLGGYHKPAPDTFSVWKHKTFFTEFLSEFLPFQCIPFFWSEFISFFLYVVLPAACRRVWSEDLKLSFFIERVRAEFCRLLEVFMYSLTEIFIFSLFDYEDR